MAGSIDWDRRATTAQQQADILREARTVASSVLVPLTPPLVVVLLGPRRQSRKFLNCRGIPKS